MLTKIVGGGVPLGAPGSNRTDWSASGGSLKLDLHHPWTYVFVNLGLGSNVTNFNYTLTPAAIWNVTGNGTFCVPSLKLPDGVGSDGQLATLQVVTLGDSGSALYNCADVTLRANVSAFGGQECTTSPGITAAAINGAGSSSCNSTSGGGAGASSGNSSGSGAKPSAGTTNSLSTFALTAAFGFAIIFSMV